MAIRNGGMERSDLVKTFAKTGQGPTIFSNPDLVSLF